MSMWCLLIITGLYSYTALELFLKGNSPMALTMLAYAAGNVGIIWSIEKGLS